MPKPRTEEAEARWLRDIESEMKSLLKDESQYLALSKMHYVFSGDGDWVHQPGSASYNDALIDIISEITDFENTKKRRIFRSHSKDLSDTREVEEDMQDALLEYLAAELSKLPDVQYFRSCLTRIGYREAGLQWSEEDIWQFISLKRSHLTTIFLIEQLEELSKERDISSDEIEYSLSTESAEDLAYKIQVFPRDGAITDASTLIVNHKKRLPLRFVYEKPNADLGRIINATIRSTSRLTGHFVSLDPNTDADEEFQFTPALSAVGHRSEGEFFGGFPGTPAGIALQITSEIARDYFLPVEDVLTFLFTGELTKRNIIQDQMTSRPVYDERGQLEYMAYGPVRLTMQPWVSPEYVAARLRNIQEMMYSSHTPAALAFSAEERLAKRTSESADTKTTNYKKGFRKQPPEQHNVSMFRFVTSSRNGHPSLRGTKLLDAWKYFVSVNHPEWAPKYAATNTANFLTSNTRIKQQILPFHWLATPWQIVSKMTADRKKRRGEISDHEVRKPEKIPVYSKEKLQQLCQQLAQRAIDEDLGIADIGSHPPKIFAWCPNPECGKLQSVSMYCITECEACRQKMAIIDPDYLDADIFVRVIPRISRHNDPNFFADWDASDIHPPQDEDEAS